MLSRQDAQFGQVAALKNGSLIERTERAASAWTASLSALAVTILCAVYALKSAGHFVCGAVSQWRAPDPHAIEMSTACLNPAVRSEVGERCHHFEWLGSPVGFLYAGIVEVQEHTYTCGVLSCSSLIPDGLGSTLFVVGVTLTVVALCLFRCAGVPRDRQVFVEDAYERKPSVRISEIIGGGSSSSDEHSRERRRIKH